MNTSAAQSAQPTAHERASAGIVLPEPKIDILTGCCAGHLMALPSASHDCCVTSPPYWNLRDYGVAGQIGLEETLDDYVRTIVGVCREIARLLRPEGTLWLNLGDCYATSPRGNKPGAFSTSSLTNPDRQDEVKRGRSTISASGLKPKDLCMIPARVALALQADGWWIRSKIIWRKPNPMPESVRDRPTSSYEEVFLLTRGVKYFYDADAIKTPLSPKTLTVRTTPRKGTGVESTGEKLNAWMERNGGRKHPESANARNVWIEPYNGKATKDFAGAGAQDASETKRRIVDRINAGEITGANAKNAWIDLDEDIWSISARPTRDAHFATFPPALVERCLKAGCPPGGRVLDPFAGSGTTGVVARRLGMSATLIELNPDYVEIIKRRLAREAGEALSVLS